MDNNKKKFDLAVIGGGPGGYVAAIRGAQRGLSVALIENIALGGTCLNRGCIPSKTLISNADVLRKVKHASHYGISTGDVSFDYSLMSKRKDQVVDRIRRGLDGLVASNQIHVFRGFGKFQSPHEIKILGQQEEIIEASSVIIATGSEARELPEFPFDGETILDSTSLLNLTKLPKKLLIVGGGVIGCEFASLHAALGVDVTIIELLPMIIALEGKNISDVLTSALKKQGVKIETNATLKSIEKNPSATKVHLTDGRVFDTDLVLISVGRKMNTDQIGLEKTGVIVNKNGTIPVNEFMRTNIPHIYAIGDITGLWLLAHVASHQGLIAADNISGLSAKMHYNAVPSIIYTTPEIATIGLTLEKALEKGIEAALGKFPFAALGKSQATMDTEGFAQIVIEKKSGRILGAQVVGYGASTLIAEMAVAIANELTVHSIIETIHAHPTLAEAWLEAALFANDLPLHLPPKKKISPKEA